MRVRGGFSVLMFVMVGMFMGVGMVVIMIVGVLMGVTVRRAVGMYVVVPTVGMFPLNLDFVGAATASGTHSGSPNQLLIYFKFLEPHFSAARHLHLESAAVRTLTEDLLHRH
jgi:hypothetical protein